MTAPLVFLDTETTGVHPGRQVWEIAMIRRLAGGEQTDTQLFVEVNLAEAEPFGLKVGKFYDRHPLGRWLSEGRVAEQPVARHEAARRVAKWTHGAHIVGAVPNFDTEVLGALLHEHGLIPAWHYHLIDVENLAVGYLNGLNQHGHSSAACYEGRCISDDQLPGLPWNSDDLSRALGVKISDEERHTAMGDAQWAMRIYDAVMGSPARA